jgi:hypothetical protein
MGSVASSARIGAEKSVVPSAFNGYHTGKDTPKYLWRLMPQSRLRFSVQLRNRRRMKSGCQATRSPASRIASLWSRILTNHWRVVMNSSGRSPFS